jgi:hypothetical protein
VNISIADIPAKTEKRATVSPQWCSQRLNWPPKSHLDFFLLFSLKTQTECPPQMEELMKSRNGPTPHPDSHGWGSGEKMSEICAFCTCLMLIFLRANQLIT